LQGKYITLAKKWFAGNIPCTLEQYFVKVTPLMPTHLMCKRRLTRLSQKSLARKAFGVLRKKLLINEDMVLEMHSVREVLDHKSLVKEWSQDDGIVVIPNSEPFNKRNALRQWIRSHGYSCIARNTYTKSDSAIKTEPKQLSPHP